MNVGADLYNFRYRDSNPTLKAVEAKMHAITHDRSGTRITTTLPEPVRKKYCKLYDTVHGDPLYYFRESYGGEGLLSLMGLSWWQDVIPLQDIHSPEGLDGDALEQWYTDNPDNMSPEACQQFIDLLQSRRAIVDAYPDSEWEEGEDFWTKEPYRTNVGEWYRGRLARLVRFLQQGVADGGIYASL